MFSLSAWGGIPSRQISCDALTLTNINTGGINYGFVRTFVAEKLSNQLTNQKVFMKKTLRMAGLMLMAIFVTFALASCGDDDDEPADPATHDPELVGVWEFVDEYYGVKDKLAIYANGKYRWDMESEESGSYWYAGRWETEDGYVTLHFDSSSEADEVGEAEVMSYRFGDDCVWFNGSTYRYDRID